ncbi:MAG: hypothetical protein KC713_09750, partial [Candidatus Omnitrophica bacterium]|nr:hypothetical protein [Candidatus Omnitrophota bacterium]
FNCLFTLNDLWTPWFFPVEVDEPESLIHSARQQRIDAGLWHGSQVVVFPCHQYLSDQDLEKMEAFFKKEAERHVV